MSARWSFPALREMGTEGSSFAATWARRVQDQQAQPADRGLQRHRPDADLGQNQDVQGDLYEYLLSHLNIAGRNGQFRTPRHIIRMMVQMIDPRPSERIGDLAAGTCGFLVNAYQHILEQHTSPDILEYDEEGWPHNLIGDQLEPEAAGIPAGRRFARLRQRLGHDHAAHRLDEPDAARHRQSPVLLHGHAVQSISPRTATTTSS